MERPYGNRWGERVEDRRWAAEMRWVGAGGVLMLATLLAVDAGQAASPGPAAPCGWASRCCCASCWCRPG